MCTFSIAIVSDSFVIMNLDSKRDLISPKYLCLLLGWLAAALSIEFSLYRLVGSLSEDIPRLYGSYAFRSLFFILSSILLVAIVHVRSLTKQRQSGIPPRKVRWSKNQSLLATGVLSTNFLFLTLLALNPELFSMLALEGSFVEPLSALFFFLGAAVLGWQAYRTVSRTFPHKLLILAGLGGLALVFFVIAMEEVSWFQRVLEFETPESFGSNLQGEFNLHNFSTKMFENAFYTGAFICLIGLPFLSATSAIPENIKGLEVFIGSRFTLCASSLLVAYNYHYWNAFSTQIPYFLTLLMLSSLALMGSKSRLGIACLAFLGALLATQAAFFLWGHSMNRLWDATEYKEFFIAFGFLLYAFDVRRNLLQHGAQ